MAIRDRLDIATGTPTWIDAPSPATLTNLGPGTVQFSSASGSGTVSVGSTVELTQGASVLALVSHAQVVVADLPLPAYPQPPVRVLLAGHSHAADGGATFPDYGGFHKLASHLQPSRLNSVAQGGAVLCAQENVTLGGGSHFGGYARFLTEVLGNGKSPAAAPYTAGQQFSVLMWGINDMAFMGPTTFQTVFPHNLRAMISRCRAASVFEENDASIAYTGTWTRPGVTGAASGNFYEQTSTQGDSLTITVPADFEGGTIALGFVTGAAGQGSLWTITGTGSCAGVNTTFDTRNINGFDNGGSRASNGKAGASVKRLTGLPAGGGTITCTVTTLATQTAFDYWQIESNDPGIVALIKDWYFLDYSIYTGWPYTPTDADMDTVNSVTQSVADEFADTRVYTVPTNDLFNKNASLFTSDKAHLNDKGHGLLAERLLSSFQARGFSTLTMTKPVTTDRRYWILVAVSGGFGGPAYQNSWVASGVAGKPITGFYKDWTNGLVSVKGSVKSGSSATAVVFTLPIGYRPREDVTFSIDGNGVAGVGKVTPTGDVSFIVGGNTATATNFSFTYFAEQ